MIPVLANGGFFLARTHPAVCPSKQGPQYSKEDRMKALTNISWEEEKVNERNVHEIVFVSYLTQNHPIHLQFSLHCYDFASSWLHFLKAQEYSQIWANARHWTPLLLLLLTKYKFF